jgi:hypothetical protein
VCQFLALKHLDALWACIARLPPKDYDVATLEFVHVFTEAALAARAQALADGHLEPTTSKNDVAGKGTASAGANAGANGGAVSSNGGGSSGGSGVDDGDDEDALSRRGYGVAALWRLLYVEASVAPAALTALLVCRCFRVCCRCSDARSSMVIFCGRLCCLNRLVPSCDLRFSNVVSLV